MNKKYLALLALLATVFLWSVLVVIARATVINYHPLFILFLRLLVASIFFIPFLIIRKPWQHRFFPKLVAVSLLSCLNLIFFMLGIQYTSASASQLIYAAIPVLIVLIGIFILKEKYPVTKISGVVIGLLGIIFIVHLSAIEKGTTIAGSLPGNVLIMIAMLGWLSYILLSKKLLRFFSPLDLASTSIIVSFLFSIPLFLLEKNFFNLSFSFPMHFILAVFYMGFFGTFLTYLLYQYGLKYTSPLTVSFTTYIQPVITTVLEIIFLDEKITPGFFFGGILVFFGVFLATTLELYHRRK